MIGAIGDLVEDIVVRLGGPVQEASDTDAVVLRRRGGSAANVAVAVAHCGHPARFIGQVGDDAHGRGLTDALEAEGVEVVAHRAGRTGTIVVLLDRAGERTMLTDRGACTALDHPEQGWLDGLSFLHVPAYSLVGEPLRRTAVTLIEWAHEQGVRVSIDVSSAAVIESIGAGALHALLAELRPSVLLCNELEAATLGAVDPLAIGAEAIVIKHGGAPAELLVPDRPSIEVPALTLGHVRDTTGAGDAFAAGFLVALANGASPHAATSYGHQSAARAITSASAS